MSALRVLELVQIGEIEMLLDTIIGDLHGKEKDLLLNESKEKIATREKALARTHAVASLRRATTCEPSLRADLWTELPSGAAGSAGGRL